MEVKILGKGEDHSFSPVSSTRARNSCLKEIGQHYAHKITRPDPQKK